MELVIKNEHNPYDKLNLHAGLLSFDVIRTVIDNVKKKHGYTDNVNKHDHNPIGGGSGVKLSDEQLKRLESLWKEDLRSINVFPYVSNHSNTRDRNDDLILKKNLEYKQHYRLAEYVKPIVSIQGFKGRPQPYMMFPPYAIELKRQQQQQQQLLGQQQMLLHLHKSTTQDRCMLNNNSQRKSLNISSNYYSNSQHHHQHHSSSTDVSSANRIGRDGIVYQRDYIIKDDDLLDADDDGDDEDDDRRSHNRDKRRRVSRKSSTIRNKQHDYTNDDANANDDGDEDSKCDGSNVHFNNHHDCTYVLSMRVEVDLSGLLKLITRNNKYYSQQKLGNNNNNNNKNKNYGSSDNTIAYGDDDERGYDDHDGIHRSDDDDDHRGDNSIHKSRAGKVDNNNNNNKWVEGRVIQITKLSVRQKGEDYLLRIRFRNGAEWDVKSCLNLVRMHRYRGGNGSSRGGRGSNSRGSSGSNSRSGGSGSGDIGTEQVEDDVSNDNRHDNDIEIHCDNSIHVRVDDYHGNDDGTNHFDSRDDSHTSSNHHHHHHDNNTSRLPIVSNTTTALKHSNIVDLLLNNKGDKGGDGHDDYDDVDDDEFNFDDDSDADISNAFDYGNNSNQFLLSNMISCGAITNTGNDINSNDENDDHYENHDNDDDNNNDDAIFNISTKNVIDKLTNTDKRHHHHHHHQSLLATGEYVSTNILEEIDSYFKKNLRLNVITLPMPRMNVDEYSHDLVTDTPDDPLVPLSQPEIIIFAKQTRKLKKGSPQWSVKLRDLYIIDSKYKADYIVARADVLIDNYDECNEEELFNIKLLEELL